MRSQNTSMYLGGVLFIFLAAAFYILFHTGMRWGGDTSIYTGGADQLAHGKGLIGKQNWHWGYILLVKLFTKFDSNLESLGAFHILLAALASLALYDLGRAMASPLCGLIAAASFLWNPDISRWHYFILTDSVYISAVILFVWSTWKYSEKPNSLFFTGLLVLATVGAASERPNAWLFIPIAFSLCLGQTFKLSEKRWILLIASMILFFTGLSLFPRTQTGIQYVEPASLLREGVVVWGFPEANLRMPQFPEPSSSLWTGDLRYVAINFFSCLRLGLARIAVELRHTRPFYSHLHNIAIYLYLIPLYLLAAIGYKLSRIPLLKFTIVCVIGSQLLIIALVCADWDGRFLLYILPLVSLLASVSVAHYLKIIGEALWECSREPVKNLVP